MNNFIIKPEDVRIGDYLVSTVDTPRGGTYVTFLVKGYRYEVSDLKQKDGRYMVLLKLAGRNIEIGWWYLDQFIPELVEANDYDKWD